MKQNGFSRILFLSFVMVLCAGVVFAQSPRILSDFGSSTEGWSGSGMDSSSVSGGFLVWTDNDGGTAYDPWNNSSSAYYAPGDTKVDLYGMDYIEYVDVAYIGADATIAVQFYQQMNPSGGFWWYAGLPDTVFVSGVTQTVAVPLIGAGTVNVVSVRTTGMSIRAHTNPATWYLNEVRTTGTPVSHRQYDFNASSPNSGYCGACVYGDYTAIQGNDGTRNQTGLSVNLSAGVDGVLEWVDVPGGNGGHIYIEDGYDYTYRGRPVDMSSYNSVAWTMIVSASPTNPSATVEAQFYLQEPGYTTIYFGSPVLITADGSSNRYEFDLNLSSSKDREFLLGLNLGEHSDTLVIQVDTIELDAAMAAVEDWELY